MKIINFFFIYITNIQQVVDKEIESYPRVSGGEPYFSRNTNDVFQKAIQLSGKTGDQFVSLEYILLAIVSLKNEASNILKDAGMTEKGLETAIDRKSTRLNSSH